jgi:hypothetical protein
VAVLVGQLAAIQRRQTQTALEREHEARAMFRVSRALATRASTTEALEAIVRGLVAETVATRAWMEIDDPAGLPRILVDTQGGTPRPSPATIGVLRRTEADAPAEWTRVHARRGGEREAGRRAPGSEAREAVYKVLMEAGDGGLGRCGWSSRAPTPIRCHRHAAVAAIADQTAQALEQDRLATEARDAAISRESDKAKTALLQTVSHDSGRPRVDPRRGRNAARSRGRDVGARPVRGGRDDRPRRERSTASSPTSDLSGSRPGAACRPGRLRPPRPRRDRARSRPAPPRRPAHRGPASEPPPVRVDPAFLDQI